MDADRPAVSVVMSVYNNADYLALAIESILAQSFGDFEFLILNDGSSDESPAIIDRYAAADARIRAIHRENKGLIYSLNQLVAESRAPLIARMDGDDICLPLRFEKQVAFMRANPDYGVVGTWTEDIDGKGQPYHLEGPDQPTDHESFVKAIGRASLLCHPSAVMRRDLVLAVGGYHAAFRHCEDFDLWMRLCSITKLCSIPERLIRYRHTHDQVSSKHVVEQQLGAAISYYAYKERAAGHDDPTADLQQLPPLSQVDDLFGRKDVEKDIRARLVPALLYSPRALKTDGFEHIVDFVKDGGTLEKLWRTIGRLAKLGEYRRALKMAFTMARY